MARPVAKVGGFLTLDPPPPRERRPVQQARVVNGSRLVILTPTGHADGLRATGQPFRGPIPGITDSDDTRLYVPACPELEWYRWAITGEPPDVNYYPTETRVGPTVPLPVPLVYVE